MRLVEIKSLEPSLIREVVEIHTESLPNDFLPGLGKDFLINDFYPAVLHSEYGNTYVAVQDGRTCGFIIITKDSSRFFKSIVKNKFWRFLKTGLKTSLSSLTQLKNNFSIIFSASNEEIKPDYGEIYEIAVKNSCQGKGIGKKLIEESIQYLKSEGIHGIKIKTQKSNVQWVNSLQKNGWRIEKEFTLINRAYVILCKEIK